MSLCKGSQGFSSGFRVQVSPAFLPNHSNTESGQFVFGYRIALTNESGRTAQLMSRCWRIVDAHGQEHRVEGDGVVGKQPTLEPGQTFSYSSFCPLQTEWGTMEGHFVMRTSEGEEFEVGVARFYLVAPQVEHAAQA
ncbi:MAG: Co2+/Mg2+ efflux protein ApaG [Phycisphaerales bacterium]